jgi:hypothetical protein
MAVSSWHEAIVGGEHEAERDAASEAIEAAARSMPGCAKAASCRRPGRPDATAYRQQFSREQATKARSPDQIKYS